MDNLGLAEAAALDGGASRTASKPRGQPVAELLNTGCVTSLPDRLALAIRLGRILEKSHRRDCCYGNLDIHAVRVTDDGQVVLSHEPEPDAAGMRADIRAFGFITNQLLSGVASEETNFESLGRAGFADALVKAVEDCTTDPTRPQVLDHTLRELEMQLCSALDVTPANRITRSLFVTGMGLCAVLAAALFWFYR